MALANEVPENMGLSLMMTCNFPLNTFSENIASHMKLYASDEKSTVKFLIHDHHTISSGWFQRHQLEVFTPVSQTL